MADTMCCVSVHDPHMWGGRRCAKKATVERGGKPYCGTHDPVAQKARSDAKHARWNRESAIRRAGYDIANLCEEIVAIARKAARQEASIDDLFAAVDRLEQAEEVKRKLERRDG